MMLWEAGEARRVSIVGGCLVEVHGSVTAGENEFKW
jgi:hypothetical protein